MRGSDTTTGSLFSYVDLERRIPARHPLRTIREVVNEALATLDAEFARLYAAGGRPSIAPEKLLRGSLIQAFFSIRSERQLMEQLEYNLLFRWFVGLGVDDPVWDHSTYSKNRDRLLEADVARKILRAILAHPKVAPLLSDEHFSVDGTLVQAWASMKSFQPRACEQTGGPDQPSPVAGRSGGPEPDGTAREGKARKEDNSEPETADGRPPKTSENRRQEPASSDVQATITTTVESRVEKKGRNAEIDFHGQKRSNATHVSTTDPDARLYRKGPGKEARLCFMGHAMTENRHGLVVEATLTEATGTVEREAAKDMIQNHSPGSERRLTVGADKAYDTAGFVAELRQMCVTPHVAQNTGGRRSAIDARTTRHAGYVASQRKRKLIEEAFGWAKTIGGLARMKLRGTGRMGFAFTFAMAAYNLIRLPKLIGGATA
jgi:transposase